MGYKTLYNGKPIDQLTADERRRYDRMCERGRAGLDEMVSTGRGLPTLHTEDTLWAAWGNTNGKQFEDDPQSGDFYRQRAEAAGVSTTGKKYLSGLAKFPGDPLAWVGDRGDIRRVAEARGQAVEGAVTVKGDDRPVERVAMAPDIVQRLGGDTPEKAAAVIQKHSFGATYGTDAG